MPSPAFQSYLPQVSAVLADGKGVVLQNRPKVYLLLETGGGGAGRHVLDLFTGLVQLGWNVHLLLSTTRMDAAFTREVALLPQERITFLKLHRSPHVTDVRAVLQIRRELQKQQGAVVLHAHSTKAGLVAWALLGTRACRIFTPHAYPCMDPGRTRGQVRLIRVIEKMFSKPFDGIIAVSEDERNYTQSLGVQAARVHQIANGVDAETVHRLAVAGRRARETDGFVLGFLGRIVEQKDPTLFVQTLAELVRRGHHARALIVGDGPLRASMEDAATALAVNDRIQWLGAVHGLPQLMNMDVMLHTSISESLPYSLLEAVAADVPVVAVCNPGSRAVFGELLPEVLVPCGTPHGLADKVEAMLDNGALSALRKDRYKLIAERFSTRDMVKKTAGVYEQSLARRTTRQAAQAHRMPTFPLHAVSAFARKVLRGGHAVPTLPLPDRGR